MLVSEAIEATALLLIGDNKDAKQDLANNSYLDMAFREVLLRCTPSTLVDTWDKTNLMCHGIEAIQSFI